MNRLKSLLAIAAFALLVFPVAVFASEGEEFRFEIKGDEFKVRGMVTEVSNDTVPGPSHDVVMVDGISVMIDPSMVDEFKQEGDLAVGAEVRAEGQVIDGGLFAEEVKVEDAEDEVEIEVEED